MLCIEATAILSMHPHLAMLPVPKHTFLNMKSLPAFLVGWFLLLLNYLQNSSIFISVLLQISSEYANISYLPLITRVEP